MMEANSNKKIFIGIIILLLSGVGFSYYFSHRESKRGVDAIENKHSSTDSSTHINPEKIPVEMGAKPEKESDGSVKIVEEFIKSHAQNPNTFQFLEWSEVSSEDGYWKVRCKYRGIASFNAEVTTNAWFYIQNNKVVYTKIISKI
jgi:hypothetical protein